MNFTPSRVKSPFVQLQPSPAFPSPFDPIESLPGMTPGDYAARCGSTDSRVDAATFQDARVAALFEERATFAWRRFRDGQGGEDAFLRDVRERGVGIAGAGLMGISIAASFLDAEIPTTLYDPLERARVSAPERARQELKTLRQNTGEALDDDTKEAELLNRRVSKYLNVTDRLDDVASSPVVVESTPEKPRLKAKLYRELEARSVPNAPITLLTNTSSLTLAELSATLPRDDEGKNTSAARFASFHFFHPATKRRPVEIAVGADTSGETARRAKALADAIGRIPMIVGDSPGFLVNRLLQAYLGEALAALDEGVDAARLENACLRFGMEGAPLRIIDEIGADVSLHAGWSFFKAFPNRSLDSAILPGLVRAERLGRKTRRGFYRYEGSVSWRDDATLDADSATLQALAAPNAFPAIPDVPAKFHTDEALVLRFLIATLFEAARLVEEAVVRSLREADAALVLALGFPQDKGGICYWSLAFGLERLLAVARELAPLGARFDPPTALTKLAETV